MKNISYSNVQNLIDGETPALAGNRFSIGVQIAGLVASLILCLTAAGIGAAVTTPQIRGWYATISKPAWNPPDWVFGPVWTTRYLMMAVSAWLVWRS